MTGAVEPPPARAPAGTGGPATGARGWEVLLGSARGALHAAEGTPIEDAVGWWPGDGGPHPAPRAAVAVSDGVGSRECFRADRGSRLAVYWACRLAGELLESGALDAGSWRPALVCELGRRFTGELVGRWRTDVRNDLAASPPTDDERAGSAVGGPAELAYGATVLLAAVSGHWLLLAQLGDGQVLVVDAEGGVSCPVPPDPRSVAGSTASLGQPRAEEGFRLAAVDLLTHPVELVALATDGYGNAFADPEWQEQVGRDLAEQLAEDGVKAVRGRLDGWLADAASVGGDDASLALLTRSADV